MSLCLADSLISHGELNHKDLRLRFLLWWYFGYNNAFRDDERRGNCGSVGLGGNISSSFLEFLKIQTGFTTAGDVYTSGNGSLMRNAPIPIFFHHDPELAIKMASDQSRTTHQGTEAAECCRLLTYVCLRGFYGNGTKDFLNEDFIDSEDFKFNDQITIPKFQTDVYSIQCLASSQQEKKHKENKNFNLQDRNWNWKSEDFKYSESRSKEQPGYVGSYAMDALSMALHCVFTTSSFEDALLKSANLRGDSDTVSAITGQIAGSIYGVSCIPPEWIHTLQQWDRRGDIVLKSYLLFHRIKV